MAGDTHGVAERVARISYGRLLAILSVRLHDVAAAEDALAAAFEKALIRWPETGVPDHPERWLVTVARNAMKDGWRRDSVRRTAEPEVTRLQEELQQSDEADPFPDERLKLLFVCAHPAIDPVIHTPLMLQTVLGLDAKRIGSAFLVAPSTMGQRLVRAKTKIRQAGIPFTIPDTDHLPERMETVLAAIYAAYGTGWDHVPLDAGQDGGAGALAGLADEALYLGRLLVDLQPDNAEARGLLALMLYTAAREQARRSAAGAYVPLDEQDTQRWNMRMISHAERLLLSAAELGRPGRYQLEAAIQSAHVKGRLARAPNWPAIISLYRALMLLAPSLGAQVSLASALARSGEIDAARTELDAVETQAKRYQPWWAAKAHCEASLGNTDAALHAYTVAIGLSEDPAIKGWLSQQATKLTARPER